MATEGAVALNRDSNKVEYTKGTLDTSTHFDVNNDPDGQHVRQRGRLRRKSSARCYGNQYEYDAMNV